MVAASLRFSFFLLLSPAEADIPVHCHAPEITGTWDLHLSTPSSTRLSCQHERPDKPTREPHSEAMKRETSLQRRVHLHMAPGIKTTGGDVSIEAASQRGAWRMIADEGFELEFASAAALVNSSASETLSLFALSHFDMDGEDQSKAVSHCEQTILGWYSIGRQQWGCWRGQQKTVTLAQRKTVLVKPKAGERLSFAQASEKVRRINARSSWTARVYSRWVGKTQAQLAQKRGVRWHQAASRHSFLQLEAEDVAVNATEEALDVEEYLQGLAEAKKRLPASVDWREARGGRSYLEPVANQGACGSCWAVSGMRMMTARHKIAQDAPDALPWSISFPLYCSEFNQGCEGGYGVLAGKWSAEVGLVPATCAPYAAGLKTCSVNHTCIAALKGAPRWRATKARYLGGRQHMATEAMIMEELHERGPMVVGLQGSQIGDEFMFYAGGIYNGESMPPKDKSGGHAVLLVGYGSEDGQNYWLVENSWGDDWGEDGYVRLSREVIHFRSAEVADVVRDEQDGRQVDTVASMAKPFQLKKWQRR